MIGPVYPSRRSCKLIRHAKAIERVNTLVHVCVNLTLAVSWTRTYYACFLVCRFAQFFICPLLSPEATSREIHAVDSGIEFCFLLFEEPFSSPLCSSVFQHFKSFYCYVTLFLLIYGTIWIWIEVL